MTTIRSNNERTIIKQKYSFNKKLPSFTPLTAAAGNYSARKNKKWKDNSFTPKSSSETLINPA